MRVLGNAPFTLRETCIDDVGWAIHRQALLYAREQGRDIMFEALLAGIGAAFIRKVDPGGERGWPARLRR